MSPLRSVDLATREEGPAAIERSDVCAVPAASVVGEAMVALVLADALLDRFGGDSIADVRQRHEEWRRQVHDRFAGPTGAATS
jgi:chorismate synthase